MLGSATFTIVMSTRSMKVVTQTANNVQRRLGAPVVTAESSRFRARFGGRVSNLVRDLPSCAAKVKVANQVQQTPPNLVRRGCVSNQVRSLNLVRDLPWCAREQA